MSAREKKLLIFFSIAGFILLNFIAYSFYQKKVTATNAALADAEQKLTQAEIIRTSRDQVADEMEWLAKYEPEPATNQDVQTKLQQLCEKEATAAGLTIESQKPLPTTEPEGAHYHRAHIQLKVTGNEQALYRWFDRLNMPEELRMATHIILSPNKKDDTLIDCTAEVEQWFVPAPLTAAAQ